MKEQEIDQMKGRMKEKKYSKRDPKKKIIKKNEQNIQNRIEQEQRKKTNKQIR